MRAILVVSVCMVSLVLLAPVSVYAEDVLTAKVYRDYPGYINPAVCENPNLEESANDKPPVGQPGAPAVTSNPTMSSEPPSTKTALTPATAPPPVARWMRSDNPIGYYGTAWAGMVATDDLELDSALDMSVDNGYGAGIALGYDFGRVRLEIEGAYRKGNGDKLKTDIGEVNAPEDLDVFTALANGYLDFPTGGPITPYLGAGGGYARAELGDAANDDFVAGQLAAGFVYAVAPKVAVDFGYKFLFPVAKEDVELQQHTAYLGIQFRF